MDIRITLMQRRSSALGALLVGLVLGVAINAAVASRNSAGTYSLPTGNPVVTGTTISSSTYNTTNSDLATEITDSLNRSGKGGMLASLKLAAGTLNAPALAWTAETSAGLYRASLNDIRFALGGLTIQKWTGLGAVFPMLATAEAGVVVTNSTSNGAGTTSTGNGSGAGGVFTGGATGNGGTFTGGGTSGIGVSGQGTGSFAGGSFTGGPATSGVIATGGTTSGPGVTGNGTGSGVGGSFTGGATAVGVAATGGGTSAGGALANGTTATGGTRQDALTLTNGDLNMSGVAYPTSTTSVTNRLTPAGLPKAWGMINVTGASTGSVAAGFNVTGVNVATWDSAVTLGGDMATADYAVLAMVQGGGCVTVTKGTGLITFTTFAADCTTALTSTHTVDFIVFGAQ